MELTNEQKTHLEYLKTKVYKVQQKWPQFQIMIDVVLNELIPRLKKTDSILVQERCYFFGGYTLFSPLFTQANCITVDCINESHIENYGKQSSWIEDEGFIKLRPDHSCFPDKLPLEDNSFDFVFVPNIIHHVKNQKGMMEEWFRVLKPGGKLLIFEGLVRELHHVPDDYLRYTPYGFKYCIEEVGFKYDSDSYGSGVFDVISYAWQQALDFLPSEIRKEKEEWFWKVHYPELQKLDKDYSVNLVNPKKSFPMSYTIWASKPLP